MVLVIADRVRCFMRRDLLIFKWYLLDPNTNYQLKYYNRYFLLELRFIFIYIINDLITNHYMINYLTPIPSFHLIH